MTGSEKICPGCQQLVDSGAVVCPRCGENLPPALRRGTLLQKEGAAYEVGAVLGQGGFGITYRGVDKRTGRAVAVKEFFPARETRWAERAPDGVNVTPCKGRMDEFTKGRMSFLKEAQVVSKLDDSPSSVVKGIDYLETNGTAYLILEFLPGKPLFKEVRSRPSGKLTPQELFPKLLPVMDGISWIHAKNIVHRDICPDNIMWKPDGTLTLTDFGSARQLGGQMTELFKPRYAPVEQETSTAGPAGWYSDVYTLAMTILYCLTGENPAQSTERVSRVFGNGQPDPLYIPDCLTPEQKAVLQKAAAIRPEDRYQTMGEFKDALVAATPWKLQPDPPKPDPGPDPKPDPPKPDPDSNSFAEFVKAHFVGVVLVGMAVALVFILLLAVIVSRSERVTAPDLPAAAAVTETEETDELRLSDPSETITMNGGGPWIR